MRRIWDAPGAHRRAIVSNLAVRLLLLAAVFGLFFTLHLPTDLASIFGRLTGRREWIDTFRPLSPTALQALFC